MPVTYDGRVFPRAFTADLIVADQILVELKSVETILPVHCTRSSRTCVSQGSSEVC